MSFDVDTNGVLESTLIPAGLDPLSPRNPFGPSQTLFADLGQGPQAMPGLPDLSNLNWDTGLQGQGKGQFENSLSSPLQPVLDEPESANSWVDKVLMDIPIVDTAAKTSAGLITNSSVFIEQAAESSRLLAKDTAEGIGDTVHNWMDTAAESWNDPSNSIHNGLNHQARAFVDSLGKLATDVGNSQWLASVKKQLGSASEGLDAWVGEINSSLGYVDDASTIQDATALEAAELRLQENLVNLSENPDFLKTFETAFGDDIEVSEATELVGDFVSGDGRPEIKVVAAADLKGEGAFGDNTIFVSDQLLAQSSDNTDALDAVLLEEAGHYFDQELNDTDSAGDEGAIFSRLARGQAIADGDLLRLRSEYDHSTLLFGDQVIDVENYYLSDAEKVEIQNSTNTPVDGSDRRLYLQSGTVDKFDAAYEAQQESATPALAPVIPVSPPENPRQADRGQPEASASPYTGMTADAAEAWSQAAEEDKASENANTVVIEGSGDTLSAIAARHGVQWTDLRKPNGEAFTEEEARLLQIGDQVILPDQPAEEPVSSAPENPRQADRGQPEASAASSAPENPRQADRGQPEASTSPYTGMSADAAEAWSQATEGGASSETNSPPENPRQADLGVSQSEVEATNRTEEQSSGETEASTSDNRFNDVNGDQSNIHGFDPSSSDESDAFFGYFGEDGNGDYVAGAGLVDYENSDENGWFSSLEILTAEGRVNADTDSFAGAEFDAQVVETDLNISGHGLNLSYLTANGNLGGNADGFGALFNANIADINYSNGAPSPDNSNDISFNGGVSAGVGGGLNFVYSDPDNDGIRNVGFDTSVLFVDVSLTSEDAGQAVEDLEAQGTEVKGGVNRFIGWLSGDDIGR